MILYNKTEDDVVAWDDIQFRYFVRHATLFGRWLWNFFPPETGGKNEAEQRKNAMDLAAATPDLLFPSEEKFDDIREASEFHGLVGPQ